MFENKVSVGPPMPVTQTASSLRGARDRQSEDRFDQVLKGKANERENEGAKESRIQSKHETVDEKAERGDKKQRDPTEKIAMGNKPSKMKGKKIGKGIAEQEISKFMDSLESELGINPARLAEVLQEKDFQKLVTSEVETTETTDKKSVDMLSREKKLLESLSDSLDLDKSSSAKLQEMVQGLENRLKSIPKGADPSLGAEFQSSIKSNKALAPMIFKGVEQELLKRSSGVGDSEANGEMESLSLAEASNLQNSVELKPSLKEATGFFGPQKVISTAGVNSAGGISGANIGGVGENLNGLSKSELRQRIIDMNERFWMKPANLDSSGGANGSSLLPSGFEDKVRAMMSDNVEAANASLAENRAGSWNIANSHPEMTPTFGLNGNALSSSFEKNSDSQFGEDGSEEKSASLDTKNFGSSADPFGLSLSRLAQPSVAGAGLGASSLSAMTSQQRQENIQQLMNGAQILVKDGGGEMKVQMTPEGLGPVELKVTMQNGRLNVEMITESKEAKKLIESQMTDLKMGLAAQKLAVDSLKVDVVSKLNTDSNTHNFTNLNHQQQQQQQQQSQEQLRQMWGQFNDQFGSQARKSSYFDVKGPKEIAEKKDPLKPVTNEASPRRVVGKGEGLNLVA